VVGYLILALLLAIPPLLGLAVGFSKRPKLIVPAIVTLLAIVSLLANLGVWIKPEGPCEYHECWDEDWLAGYFAVVTVIWWIISAGVGYLMTLLGSTLRKRYEASLHATAASSR